MSLSPKFRAERARLAGLVSRHGDDTPEVAEARRRVKQLGAEDYLRELVASAPPLTAEQRSRLAAILQPVADRAHKGAA